MENKHFTFREVLSYGWKAAKDNIFFFVGVGFVYITVTGLAILMKLLLPNLSLSWGTYYVLKITADILSWFISIVLSIGFIKIALCFCDQTKPNIGKLFDAWDCFWRYAGTMALYTLIVMGGYLLLIVPGIIWSIKYGLSFYFVIDKGLDPIGALKASAQTTKGVKWQLFGLGIVSVLINVAGIFCLLVGLFMTYPTVMVAFAVLYRKLAAQTPELSEISITGSHLEADICLAEKSKDVPKTMLLAILSLLLSISSVLMFISIWVLVITIGIKDSLIIGGFAVIIFFITNPLSIAFGITSLYRINKHKPQIKGEYIACSGIGISVFLIFVFIAVIGVWSFDTEPIVNDYTIADLKSVDARFNQSYDLITTLTYEGESPPEDAPLLGLTAEDVNLITDIGSITKQDDYSKVFESIKTKAIGIERAWGNGEKGRDLINKLAQFPEIADLSKPSLDNEIKYCHDLKNMIYLYNAYVYLEIGRGDKEKAVDELIHLDSVFRKLNINARSMITKLFCIATIAKDIKTANCIANNPQTSRQTIELLAKHFQPFTDEQLSMRNAIISEYIMFEDALDKYIGVHFNTVTRKTAFPLYKRNSTLRLYRNYIDNWMSAQKGIINSPRNKLSPLPSFYPSFITVSIDRDGNVPPFYSIYNPIGSLAISIMVPNFDRVFRKNTDLAVLDDLLQIALNKRLGRQVNLKARAYSEQYIVDMEQKTIYSPGPDGQPHTKDDITLFINPEVINFAN